MATGVLLDAWLEFSRDNAHIQQFGTYDDESTYNGATGCTHSVLQRLIKAKTGELVSHDQISKVAGYPWPSNNPGKRGLRGSDSGYSEVDKVLKYWKLPMDIVFNKTFQWVLDHSKIGPAMLGIRYGYWPEDRGYIYNGRLADGKPGGFAIRNGKTQLSGAESIYHATTLLGRRITTINDRSFANEPNHRSPSRPEMPDYDTVLTSQAKRAYDQYASTGRSRYAWVPTATFKPKGY